MYGHIDNDDSCSECPTTGCVECVYTGRIGCFNTRAGANDNSFNCEHTWPQSFFCENEPMVGQVEGIGLNLDFKRRELTEISGKLTAERYTKLSQELEDYTAEWQLLSQLAQTSCRDLAACNYRARGNDAVSCNDKRASQLNVSTQIITLAQSVKNLQIE